VTLPTFDSLLAEHGALVLRVLTRIVGPDAAQDCWQETFLSGLSAYPRLRPESNLRGWLLTIAHRKAIDALRARSREPLPVGERLAMSSAAVDDPAQAIVESMDGEQLWVLVGGLPEKQRLAVAYRFGADLGYSDLAEVLGCSQAAARRSVFEGLRTLRSLITVTPGGHS
jgi:RNA polymerase sigma factor (sigma-70 family)